MVRGLKDALLKATGNSGGGRRDRNDFFADAESQSQNAMRSSSLTEDDIVRRLSNKSKGRGTPNLRRRFLLRLAIALHSYGSSAARTEYLIEKAANRLDVDVNIAVFPSLILLSFPGGEIDEISRREMHLLNVENDLDVDKLGRADSLANHVGKDTPLILAYWRLKAIATSDPEFGKWWRLAAYSLSAAMSALLFFEGSLWDGVFALLLGLVVGILDIIATKSSLFASVLEFSSAAIVSASARLLTMYLTKLNLCFFSLAISALVQLLPGLSLTMGVSEMVAKAHVTGTSRIMYALFSALQLGFGIAVGENVIFWAKLPVESKCAPPDISMWWSILWFAGFALSSNVLLNARPDQWTGMTVTSGVGYAISFAAGLRLDSNASSVIAAFAVGVTGTAYSHYRGDLPLIMVLSGVLVLVPGGIGVQGVEAMLKDDVLSGMSFVFDMLVVGLSITIGLLLAKIAFPSGLFGKTRSSTNNRSTLAEQLQQDKTSDSDEEEEEDMAI